MSCYFKWLSKHAPLSLRWQLILFKFQLKDFFVILIINHVPSQKISSDNQCCPGTIFLFIKTTWRKDSFSANCFVEVRMVHMIKESKFNWWSSHKFCIMLSLDNFHKKKIWLIMAIRNLQRRLFRSPQYVEEFIKSFQFSLVTTLSRFWMSQGRESLCEKQKSSTIALINSSWPELWKIDTSLRSEFIFYKSCLSEFIYHLSYCSFVCTGDLRLRIVRQTKLGGVYLTL